MGLTVFYSMSTVLLFSCGATILHFPKSKETVSVCVNQQQGKITFNSTNAEGGQPPITYSIAGGNGFFQIDSATGQVTAAKLLQSKFQSQYVLNKTATDKVGNTDVLKVAVIVLERRQQLRCSNMHFSVREIAPVGEIVGKIKCTANNVQCMNDQTALLGFEVIPVQGRYQPFVVTAAGNIVVSGPLVFRSSIQDMIIVNMRINNRYNATAVTQDDKGTDTNITLNITIEKAECPSNWTYTLQDNIHLAVPAVTTFTAVSIEECKSTCSRMKLPCSGFVYSLVQRRCDLQNETRDTQPRNVRNRPGTRLYQKRCVTEPLPSPEIRAIAEKVSGNGSIAVKEALTLYKDLQDFLRLSDEVTSVDIRFGAQLLKEIISRTSLHSVGNDSEVFIKASGHALDSLLSDRFEDQWQLNAENGSHIIELLRAFEMLSDRVVSELDKDIDFSSNTTALHSVMVDLKQQFPEVQLGVKLSGNSSVSLPAKRNYSESNPVRLFVGVLDRIWRYYRPQFHNSITPTSRSTDYLVGHIVSVALSPYEEQLYAAPFQLDILIQKKRIDAVCKADVSVLLGAFAVAVTVMIPSAYKEDKWSADGCWVVSFNLSHTRCQCTHLTNFAVLMQVTDFALTEEQEVSLDVITIIGCCFSIAALVTTLVILLWVRLQSDRYILLMNLSVALILAQVLFLSAADLVDVEIVCRLVAILLHYLFLTVFTLMLAQGIQLYHKLHRAFSPEISFTMYLVLGWGTPFILVCLSLATNLDGYGTEKHCWLSTKEGAIWAFVGPALTIVSINMVVLIIIMRIFLGVKVNAKKKDTDKFVSSMKAAFVLLPLLGITWMFGVLAINNDTVVFQYIFALLNSLQGVFIFLFHIVFNKEVRRACGGHKGKVMSWTDLAPVNGHAYKETKKN